MPSSNDFDFGFTSTEELTQPIADDRLLEMRKLIQPLLNNLLLNPDKDIIQWNGKKRQEQIKDFIQKLDAICPL